MYNYQDQVLEASMEWNMNMPELLIHTRRLRCAFGMAVLGVAYVIGYFMGCPHIALIHAYIWLHGQPYIPWPHVTMGACDKESEYIMQYLDEVAEWIPADTTSVFYDSFDINPNHRVYKTINSATV